VIEKKKKKEKKRKRRSNEKNVVGWNANEVTLSPPFLFFF